MSSGGGGRGGCSMLALSAPDLDALGGALLAFVLGGFVYGSLPGAA
jgi:hypothetical protein